MDESKPKVEVKADCIFCSIIQEGSDVIWRDEEFAAFRDRRPAGHHHYLIVPLRHMEGLRELRRDSAAPNLIRRMETFANKLLDEEGGDEVDRRLGFHWPFCSSVSHLHLHAISPAEREMRWWQRWIEFNPKVFPDINQVILWLQS